MISDLQMVVGVFVLWSMYNRSSFCHPNLPNYSTQGFFLSPLWLPPTKEADLRKSEEVVSIVKTVSNDIKEGWTVCIFVVEDRYREEK